MQKTAFQKGFWGRILFKGLLFCVWFSAFTSCGNSQKKLSPKFHELYVELRLTGETYGNTSPKARLERNRLLQEYGFSMEDFQKQTEILKESPELWLDHQNKVVAYLDSIREDYIQSPKPAKKPKKPKKFEKDPANKRKSDK